MNCPNCTGKNYVEYSLNTKQDEFKINLVKTFDATNHSILKCGECEGLWYKNENYNGKIFSFKTSNLCYLKKWIEEEHQIDKKLFTELRKIGNTPIHKYGNRFKKFEIPASCKFKDSTIEDICLIRFQDLPPFLNTFSYYNSIKSVSEVCEISPSKYALDLQTRTETSKSEEIRMGFAPTTVKSKDNKYYVLNWTTNFFKYGNIKGCDVSFVTNHPKESEMIYANESKIEITYVIGDWSKIFEE